MNGFIDKLLNIRAFSIKGVMGSTFDALCLGFAAVKNVFLHFDHIGCLKQRQLFV